MELIISKKEDKKKFEEIKKIIKTINTVYFNAVVKGKTLYISDNCMLFKTTINKYFENKYNCIEFILEDEKIVFNLTEKNIVGFFLTDENINEITDIEFEQTGFNTKDINFVYDFYEKFREAININILHKLSKLDVVFTVQFSKEKKIIKLNYFDLLEVYFLVMKKF